MEAVTLGTVVRAPSIVSADVRPDGVCVLTLDDPGETHNTITPQLGAELAAALEAADRDGRVKAVVLRSGKPESFLVGANIDYLRTIRFAKDAEEASLEVSKRFGRIATSKKPVVACVHGAALGGGFELSLACTATVATDDRATLLGLPEVKLGLMPAANGLLRVAQRAGLKVAIDLGLTGRSVKASKALALGFVDKVVAPAEALEASCHLALQLARRPDLRRALPRRRAWLRHRGSPVARLREAAPRVLLEKNPIGRAVLFRRARAEAAKETRGHYPAAGRMLDVLARFGARGFGSAAKLEAHLFGELVVSETSHRLVELFFATSATKKDPGVEHDERERAQAHRVERVAVIGAGLMGAGIAGVTVQAGLPVQLTDTDEGALQRGLAYVKDGVAERERRGSISALERDQTIARLEGATTYDGVETADLVIEAVFEELALKHAVLRDLEARVKDTCVIASNTASLPIARLAEASARPERILGMHYFAPVHRVPLLEVVRTAHTDPGAVATAVAVGKRQGKTVIVVRDGTGFYTTRILSPFLNEAAQMLTEGVSIPSIDDALVDWGFPTGPLHMLDEIGIDLAAHVARAMHAAFGERLRIPEVLAALRSDDRKGKKNGRGFYLHGRGPRAERRVDDTVYQALPIRPLARPMPDEISLRCTMALVNEALRCLDEGILRSARDGDIGAIFGLGFPPFRGGPFRYVDVLGAPEILRRTRSLEQRFGARFEPAPLLVEMARKGKRFY
ncbi:MAG TPA: 3-hydroxyacyl-CoA dehydrogenase NAD-binding domain-containing protein [Labilithrix sp.]|nr:3-hydroxyacyl-CoA dehydrogenase NAD-binding domain-containing protein [Labilithrix sp.]